MATRKNKEDQLNDTNGHAIVPVAEVRTEVIAPVSTLDAPPPSSHDSLYNYSRIENDLLKVLMEIRNGNFSVRMPIDQVGTSGKICDLMNEIIFMNERMMSEFIQAGNTIGKQGKLNHRIDLPYARGDWKTGVDALNNLISDLVHPTTEIARVISSVAKGNLSEQMPLRSVRRDCVRLPRSGLSGSLLRKSFLSTTRLSVMTTSSTRFRNFAPSSACLSFRWAAVIWVSSGLNVWR